MPDSIQPYARNMLGYGRFTPHPHWPHDARVAVQCVINYEEGSENCLLHGDSASEAFLSESIGALPLYGKRNMNMESMYDYGRPHLVIPYTLDANDMRFASPQGFNAGDQFFTYLHDAFDVLYAEGDTAPKMMSVGLHCRLVGRPGRATALARFLDYAQGHDHVWICRRLDIAQHWHTHHKPRA